MQFSEFLTQSATEINLELKGFLKNWYKEIDQMSPRITPLAKALGDATTDGKRIRGTLVILGYALVSKNPNPELLKIAAAYELFQTAILAHDDIIDNSPTRRGRPSLHTALGGGSYGTSQAICLGDIGFFAAYKLLSESNFDDSLKTKATAFFSNSMIKTAYGEMLDIELSQKDAKATEQDILDVARLKTAYYTFVAPLTLGAILAGAEDELVRQVKVYGENIGIAFQLQDDIKDIFGTERSLKKPVGGDVREGKDTILFAKAKEKADKKQKELLTKYYGNPEIGGNDIEAVKKVFHETGALKYAQSLIKEYSDKARKAIPEITSEQHLQIMLGEIIDYIVEYRIK